MPLTEMGFKRRTFAEILDDKIAKCKELFGEDINTEENTPLGKFIRINAYDQSLIEEEAELIYYSIFPNTATGVSLDRLCVFAGITRNEATQSRYKVEITGTAGAVVPQGFLVGTENEIEFETIEEATIGDTGTVEIMVDCTESGEIGNVSYSAINTIINPATDIDAIQGIDLVFKGNDTESDYELRQRFNAAKAGLGACNETSIKSAVMRVPTVTDATIVVNESDETDANGRPPKSFECYVQGGEDYHAEIAKALYDKKPLGIKTCGVVSVDIDSAGKPYTIKFSHTQRSQIFVRMTIKTDTRFQGSKGRLEIKENLGNYINTLGLGGTLIHSQLYGKVYAVTGVTEVVSLEISQNGTNWYESNMSAHDYASFQLNQVEINGEVV